MRNKEFFNNFFTLENKTIFTIQKIWIALGAVFFTTRRAVLVERFFSDLQFCWNAFETGNEMKWKFLGQIAAEWREKRVVHVIV